MGLNLKHRPTKFEELYGNEVIKESLKKKLDDRSKQSFFFTGEPGTGKTTLGRLIKEYLEISDMDFYEYNAANTRGIDTVRDIRINSELSAVKGDKKIYLLDEFHQVTNPAQEALLKLLEEPPSHVLFVLCTSEPEKMRPKTLKAIKRRCYQAHLQPLSRKDMLTFLRDVTKKEKVSISTPVFRKILKYADGSAGSAIALLDILIDLDSEDKMIKAIQEVTISEDTIKDICKALLSNNNTIVKWGVVQKRLQQMSGEAESNRYAILNFMNSVLLNNKGVQDHVAEMIMLFSESVMYSGKAGLTSACYLACKVDIIPF